MKKYEVIVNETCYSYRYLNSLHKNVDTFSIVDCLSKCKDVPTVY